MGAVRSSQTLSVTCSCSGTLTHQNTVRPFTVKTSNYHTLPIMIFECIARAERDGTRAETRFRLSPKRTSPFKSLGVSVQSNAGSRGVRISFSNSGYTTFGGGVRVLATHSVCQFPLHFPSRASPCATRFRTSYNNYSLDISMVITIQSILTVRSRMVSGQGYRRKSSPNI